MSGVSFLGVFLDPLTGTNTLYTAGESISLAAQFRGHTLIPHSMIAPGPFSGWNPLGVIGSNPNSPGKNSSGTPFGLSNAEPLALDDYFTLTEDDLTLLDVLLNDYDGDGNDRLVVVDVSTVSDPLVGDEPMALSLLGGKVDVVPADLPLRGSYVEFDPRLAAVFQSLPAGGEILDTFHYETIDIGSAPVGDYPGGNSTSVWITSLSHRLESGDRVKVSDCVTGSYNGEHEILVIDEHTFAILGVPFFDNPDQKVIGEVLN